MKLLACLTIALTVALTGCDSLVKTPTPEPSPRLAELQAVKAQAEAQVEMQKAQVEMQKRLVAIQLDVIKRCADRGGIPVIFNGNVDCKVTK